MRVVVSELPGLSVAEARGALDGLPALRGYRRFALRNFRRRLVTVEDALEALQGCRTQALPEVYLLAA